MHNHRRLSRFTHFSFSHSSPLHCRSTTNYGTTIGSSSNSKRLSGCKMPASERTTIQHCIYIELVQCLPFLLFTGEHPAAMSHNAASSPKTTNSFSSHFRTLSFVLWMLAVVLYTRKLLTSPPSVVTLQLQLQQQQHQASNAKQLSRVKALPVHSNNNCCNHNVQHLFSEKEVLVVSGGTSAARGGSHPNELRCCAEGCNAR